MRYFPLHLCQLLRYNSNIASYIFAVSRLLARLAGIRAQASWRLRPVDPSWSPMGRTGTTNGEPGLARDGTAPRPHGQHSGPPGPVRSGPARGACPALADLYHTHYRSLLRLATLLTGDASIAEAVVVDSFVALHRLRKNLLAGDALPSLRRLVVARSRPAARHHRPAGGERSPAAGRPGAAGGLPPSSESRAVLLALRALTLGQREAAVLTFYLDLTEVQAAAAMQVSQAALGRHLTAARAALRAALSAEP